MSLQPSTFESNACRPFVLTDQGLIKLGKLVDDYTHECRVSVRRRDGVECEYDGVSEVLSLENASRRAIMLIRVQGNHEPDGKYFSVSLVHLAIEEGVRIRIGGTEDDVVRSRDKVLDLLAGMRPWYGWVPMRTIWTVSFMLMILAVLYSITKIPDYVSETYGIEPTDAFNLISLAVALVVVFVLFCAIGFFGILFNGHVIALGQGLQRHKRLDVLRWIMLGSLPVGIVASVIANWIT